MSNIKDHIGADKTVSFVYCEGDSLWYVCDASGLMFPVPLSDLGGARFLARDKSIFFMRWIRKQLKEVEAENNWKPTDDEP